MRDFLWEGIDTKGSSHLIRWDIASLPKEYGGLGIGNIRTTNSALLTKELWGYLKEKDSLWSKLISAKCTQADFESIPSLYKYGSSTRSPWFHI